jgi:hypothetical protein
MPFKQYSTCRICGSNKLLPVVDLGNQPPANALVEDPTQSENFYPLKVYSCKVCGLIQLTDVVEPSELLPIIHILQVFPLKL